MNKVYNRINWKNYPNDETPLNEANLNKMDYSLNEVDNRVVAYDTTKANQSTVLNLIADADYDEETGIITLYKLNGEQILFDLNIEKVPVSFELDEDGILIMTTEDGTQFTADIGSMIPILTFQNSDTIAVTTTGTGINKTYSFSVKAGSITADKLQPNYLADVTAQKSQAVAAATSSQVNAVLSESYAVGGTGTRPGENTDNAKWYMEEAKKQTGDIPTKLSDLENDTGFITASANVASATRLVTARTINGTAFDGTGNITTANWGTARNITIGNTAKSVNGSANVGFSLTEIGALGTSGDGSNVTTTFTQATTRANLSTGEALKTSFGKIMKWFADLKDAAFQAVANNLTTTAAGSVLDARQGPVIDSKIAVLQNDIDTLNSVISSLHNQVLGWIRWSVVSTGAASTNLTVTKSVPTGATDYRIVVERTSDSAYRTIMELPATLIKNSGTISLVDGFGRDANGFDLKTIVLVTFTETTMNFSVSNIFVNAAAIDKGTYTISILKNMN